MMPGEINLLYCQSSGAKQGRGINCEHNSRVVKLTHKHHHV